MNPREMQKAMKRLGIKQEEIDAQVVIIKLADKDLVINNPQVSKVNMMGQESIQVIGEITEVERRLEPELNEDDIETVIEQTGCKKDDAISSLKQSNGNIAEAILKLQDK